MLSPVIVRASLVSLAALSAASVLQAQSAREAVYFTTSDKIWRTDLSAVTPMPAVVATEAGASLRGLAVRYDGNGAVTLLAANETKTGGVRAYACPATGGCTTLGTVASLKYARAVALDTNGNAYAVNEDYSGADQLLYLPRNSACAANASAPGCLPGGYAAPVLIDDSVDGATLLTDVKVVAGGSSFGTTAKYGPGDVLVLVEKPARLLVYKKADIAAYLAAPLGPKPVPTLVTSDFDCEEPENFAVFATGELLVATARGRVLVFGTNGLRQTAPFADLHDEAVGLALGVTGGAGADPVTGGRVLVTLRCDNRLVSLGVARGTGGELLATAGGPVRSVATAAAYGVGDASVAGSVYTAPSGSKFTVSLASHEVTIEKANTGGFLEGNYYVISEASVRAAQDTSCPDGKMTIENIPRCVPWYVRGYALGATPCLSNGTGCYYLVFSADTGIDLFGGTQEHHFEEDEFGFATTCYASTDPGAAPDAKQPRVFYATDLNDPAVVEHFDFSDISVGCNSHIGRGGQFSLFLTAWDSRKLRDIVTGKLENLERALNGCDPAQGGLASYIDKTVLGSSKKKGSLAYWLDKAEDAWRCKNTAGTLSALDSFLALVRSSPSAFTEAPTGLPTRNTPGELIARGESAWFLACGAKESCQRRIGP